MAAPWPASEVQVLQQQQRRRRRLRVRDAALRAAKTVVRRCGDVAGITTACDNYFCCCWWWIYVIQK